MVSCKSCHTMLSSPPPPPPPKKIFFFLAGNHKLLMENDPSVMQLIRKFLNSGESNFIHIALWIVAQFSGAAGERGGVGRDGASEWGEANELGGLTWIHSIIISDPNTKTIFRNSGLLEKMELVKQSRNSVEMVGLAESALVHFEVSYLLRDSFID